MTNAGPFPFSVVQVILDISSTLPLNILTQKPILSGPLFLTIHNEKTMRIT